jgi:hypothetical protein
MGEGRREKERGSSAALDIQSRRGGRSRCAYLLPDHQFILQSLPQLLDPLIFRSNECPELVGKVVKGLINRSKKQQCVSLERMIPDGRG